MEADKDLIRRWLKMGEGGFTGDFSEFFTQDYQGHLSGQAPQSLEDLMTLERGFAAAFSNITYNVEDLLAVDSKSYSGFGHVRPIRANSTGSNLRIGKSRSPGS